MTWLALRHLLTKVPARVYLGAGTLALLLLVIWAAKRHYAESLKRSREEGRTEVQHDAEIRMAAYDGAVQVLGTELRAAQLQLASSTKKVDAKISTTRKALSDVTPAIRETLPPVVQIALAEADSLLPLVTQLRIDITTVSETAAALHAVDTAMVHAQAIVINTVIAERDAARAESARKITKTTVIVGGAIVGAIVGALSFFLGKQQ